MNKVRKIWECSHASNSRNLLKRRVTSIFKPNHPIIKLLKTYRKFSASFHNSLGPNIVITTGPTRFINSCQITPVHPIHRWKAHKNHLASNLSIFLRGLSEMNNKSRSQWVMLLISRSLQHFLWVIIYQNLLRRNTRDLSQPLYLCKSPVTLSGHPKNQTLSAGRTTVSQHLVQSMKVTYFTYIII